MNSLQSHKRYAVYYAPETGSEIDQFGRRWLSCDDLDSQTHERLGRVGISNQQLKTLVAPAAHYGFHATLKPPFYLASADLEVILIKRLNTFAAAEKPFVMPNLKLKYMADFMALVPQTESFLLNGLAARCVRFFDAFRKPESDSQMNKRRKVGLNSRQEKYLLTWGYPYVLEEFRFHLTLTGQVKNETVKQAIYKELETLLADVLLDRIYLDSICLYVQESWQSPFMFHSRYPFF